MNYGDHVGSSREREVVTRTFRIHRFDPHPRRKMIIIHGEVLITVSNTLCQTILAEDTKEFKKVISLEGLTKEIDRELIVEEVIRECPFIDPELRLHLAVTIDFVKNRKYDDNGVTMTQTPSSSDQKLKSKSNASTPTDFADYIMETEAIISSQASEVELNEKVDMASLESYVELLYEEDFMEKARGARCIGKLTKSSENLAVIAYHETALNALFRTLREDYRKSMDLTTHIMSVCLNYAQFNDFHQLLLTNKICSVTFDLIEFELQRYENWRLEVARRQDIVENRSEFPGSAGSFQKAKSDFEKMRQKFAELTRKQDHLLALAFDVILYLSENVSLHPEILSRGIVPMLMDTLGRKNIDLLKVVLKFLKNISIFMPCKIQMAQMYITEKLAQLLDANIPNEIVHCSLELLFNLSFDTKLRHKMVIFGLLHKLAFYLEDSVLENVSRRILYVMSMDRKVRPKFGSILQIIPILTKSLNENREEPARNSLDVAGILVNIATNKKCAQSMCENNGLVSLLQQAFESEDEIVMKIVRNLSSHQGTKALFAAYICDLARAIKDASSEEFVLECIGTLSNLELPNIDFCKLLEEFQLVLWIHTIFTKYLDDNINNMSSSSKKLLKDKLKESSMNKSQQGQDPNQLVLEVVILTGTCSGDAECADMLIQDGILDLLIKMIICSDDTDLKTQILYVFYKMCNHSGAKQHLQERTRVPKIVLELLQHEKDTIQQLCEGIMNQFGENDQSWMHKLREKRFRIHNEAWIEMTERPTDVDADEDDDPYGFAYGSTREKVVVEFPSSASETLMTEDESEEEQSDLEIDREIRDHHNENVSSDGRNIFDRFKAQYEHEMKAKEQWDQRDLSDEEDEDETPTTTTVIARSQYDKKISKKVNQRN